MKNNKLSRFFSVVGFPTVFAALGVVAFVFRQELAFFTSSPETFKSWTEQWGIVSPLVFIGVQILQVVIFFIPGEIPQIAGGYIFGVLPGLFYSIIGICIGSAFNFWIAKRLGVPFVERVFGKARLDAFENIIRSPKAMATFFLLFLVPGIPKDILCYVAGLSELRFSTFLWISMAGRIPGILGSVLIGSSIAEKRWILGGLIFFAAVAVFIAGLLFRDRIFSWIVRTAGNKKAVQKDGSVHIQQ